MQAEHASIGSTRAIAPRYSYGMRSPKILIPLLLILAANVRCKDETPAGGEFGDPCGEVETPCAEGLQCYIGYCEEKCSSDSDCQPVEGSSRECDVGEKLCHIICDEASTPCPQTLATPLECNLGWCNAIGGL